MKKSKKGKPPIIKRKRKSAKQFSIELTSLRNQFNALKDSNREMTCRITDICRRMSRAEIERDQAILDRNQAYYLLYRDRAGKEDT